MQLRRGFLAVVAQVTLGASVLGVVPITVNSAHAVPAHCRQSGRKCSPLAPMLKQVNPAVVNIATFTNRPVQVNPLLNDPFFRRFSIFPDQAPMQQQRERRAQAAGSGVIIDAARRYGDHHNHVVDGADEVKVILNDGRSFSAKVVERIPTPISRYSTLMVTSFPKSK